MGRYASDSYTELGHLALASKNFRHEGHEFTQINIVYWEFHEADFNLQNKPIDL